MKNNPSVANKNSFFQRSDNSSVVYYSSNEALNLFEMITNKETESIRTYLASNPKAEIWNYREDNQYTILHRLAFQQVCIEAEKFFPIVIDILTFIKKNLENKNDYIIFLNSKTSKGYTAAHYASFRGNAYLLSILIEEGADIELKNLKGLNILHFAAQGNQATTLTYIKEKYNDLFPLNCTDNDGSTPLHWACYSGSEIAVNFLISWGVDMNIKDNEGATPMHLAVLNDRKKILQRLLQAGANKYIKDNKGLTPIDISIQKKNESLISMLKDKKCCNMCIVKVPMEKVNKSKGNIILLVVFYILSLASNIILGLCSIKIENNNKNKTINFILNIIYFCLVLISIIVYIILLCINISDVNINMIQNFSKLIEDKIEKQRNVFLNYYCPVCKIRTKKYMVHCFICNKCTPDFDHHCYWIDKDVGDKNFCLFITFIFLMFVLLAYNTVICFYDLIYFIHHYIVNDDRKLFDGICDSLLISTFCKKIKIGTFNWIRFIFAIINGSINFSFFFPVAGLVIIHIRNIIINRNERIERKRLRSSEDYINLDSVSIMTV